MIKAVIIFTQNARGLVTLKVMQLKSSTESTSPLIRFCIKIVPSIVLRFTCVGKLSNSNLL